MGYLCGSRTPLFRFQRGLLLRGLPRAWIPARAVRGLPLPFAALQLGSGGLQEPVPDPVGQGPAVLVGRREPVESLVCTSHIERQNLHMRMQLRRLTRLTNGFSKKWENLQAALALHFWNYNFCWMHSAIRCTPAMAAGVARKPLRVADLLAA
jgi:hypothetical protein